MTLLEFNNKNMTFSVFMIFYIKLCFQYGKYGHITLDSLFYFIVLTFGITGTSVQAGELCYTDYYTLEYCEHGCCGTDVTDRHCCTKQPDLGTILGCSIGGGVLLIITIVVVILLCKYTKTTKDIHPDESTLSSISEQTGDSIHTRCDTSRHSHFHGVIHVTPGSYTKKVGINSHVIGEQPSCSSDVGASSTSVSGQNIPSVFTSRKLDRQNSYRTSYSPTDDGDIPEIITD